MINLNLKKGDRVFYFHPEDPCCWALNMKNRRVIEYVICSATDDSGFDPVFGRRYGVLEVGKKYDNPIFIYDRFFEKASYGKPSCFLNKADAEQAVLNCGFDLEE